MKALIGALALLAVPAAAAEAPDPHRLALAAGYKAAFLCSGRWNAGQSEAAIAADEFKGIYKDYEALIPTLPAVVDEAQRTVSVKFADTLPPRIAVWRPLLGCAQLPVGAGVDVAGAVPRLAPGVAVPDLTDSDARPWPLGDAGAVRPVRNRRQRAALERVVQAAFGSDYRSDRTTAVIVIRGGNIVAERYRAGWTMHTPQRTWSVAKSLTATLVGRAVQLGLVDVNSTAPVPEWQAVGDPRARITWNQLLRMNSGLWTAGPGNRTDEAYLGGATVVQTAAIMPLEHAPGTHFNYSNNDIMLAALALSRRLSSGSDPSSAALAFPFTELLWKAGMTRTTPETDWRGDFILSSQVWMTARDLARLALLYHGGGRIGGEQLLPPDWPAFVEAPAMTQPQGRPEGYGAGFWRWGGLAGLPPGTYAMNGNRGQYAVIVPAADIIVVRRGFDAAGAGFDMPRFAADVVAAMQK